MKTFKNLKQVFESVDSHVTAQALLNGRLYLKGKGWTAVNISDELRENVISKIVESAGGRENTKVKMYAKMRNSHPQHWAIARFLLIAYKTEPYFSYCAGQDQQLEMKALREFLK